MEDMIKMDIKGIIPCPACSKKFVFAYSDARGHASVPCVRCGRISMVDYEKMSATLMPPLSRKNKVNAKKPRELALMTISNYVT